MTERNPLSAAHRGRPATSQEMRAFAHPLRMQLYRLLGDLGQATASVLARETGESTGQTSYHLRQLARYGFVEEVADEGTARERWWRAKSFSYDEPVDPGDQVSRTLSQWLIDGQAETLRSVAERWPQEPDEWRRASTMSSTTTWMTRQELEGLTEELLEVVDRHAEAARQRREAGGPVAQHLPAREGERRVRVYVDTVPLREPTAGEGGG